MACTGRGELANRPRDRLQTGDLRSQSKERRGSTIASMFAAGLPQGLGQRFEQIFERGAFTQRDHHLGGHAGAQAVVAAQRRDLMHFGRRYHPLDLEIFKASPVILETVRRYLADLAHTDRRSEERSGGERGWKSVYSSEVAISLKKK